MAIPVSSGIDCLWLSHISSSALVSQHSGSVKQQLQRIAIEPVNILVSETTRTSATEQHHPQIFKNKFRPVPKGSGFMQFVPSLTFWFGRFCCCYFAKGQVCKYQSPIKICLIKIVHFVLKSLHYCHIQLLFPWKMFKYISP